MAVKTILMTYCQRFDNSWYHQQCTANWTAVILHRQPFANTVFISGCIHKWRNLTDESIKLWFNKIIEKMNLAKSFSVDARRTKILILISSNVLHSRVLALRIFDIILKELTDLDPGHFVLTSLTAPLMTRECQMIEHYKITFRQLAK